MVLALALAGCARCSDTESPVTADETAVVDERVADTAGPPPRVRYALRFTDAVHHHIDVEVRVPTRGAETLEFMLPTWMPGSYMIRDYARHIMELQAFDAKDTPLKVRKTTKSRWRVQAKTTDEVRLTYRVFAFDKGVQGNFVERDMAILNGGATFLTPVDYRQAVHEVRLELPSGWGDVATGLTPKTGESESDGLVYETPNYDVLVDSPFMLGQHRTSTFKVGALEHALVHGGELAFWDTPKSAKDVEVLVRTVLDFWGQAPYQRFVFLNAVLGKRGGLEHATSTLLMADPWVTRGRESYVEWLGLVSHEFFHVWNVKSLRPKELTDYDYEREMYTPSLWVAEGLTSYYDDLLVHRAGLTTRKEYLAQLSKNFEKLHTTPGRQVQTLAEASWDAWIKFYRWDEHTANMAVSYYKKGAVLGFVLDAAIREASDGDRSLDDVMRRLYERHAESGYTQNDFWKIVTDVAGRSFDALKARALHSTDELDYAAALAWYGLRFDESKAPGAKAYDEAIPGWLGAKTAVRDGRLWVTSVLRETPAYEAGLTPEDELLAVDGFRVEPQAWEERLAGYRPGDEIELTISRRGRLLPLVARLATKPEAHWQLEVSPRSSGSQRGHLEAWLGQ